MTAAYSIVPAAAKHIRPMSRDLRHEATVALGQFGFNPREALRRAYVNSFYARTALIGERPVAMWGVAGMLLGDMAEAWLVLSNEVRRMPRAIVREAKAELSQAMARTSHVSATVLPNDADAVRFALHLGFRGDDEDDIFTDPKYRVALGDSYGIRLDYRGTA